VGQYPDREYSQPVRALNFCHCTAGALSEARDVWHQRAFLQADNFKMTEMWSQQGEKVPFEKPVEAKGMPDPPPPLSLCTNLFSSFHQNYIKGVAFEKRKQEQESELIGG